METGIRRPQQFVTNFRETADILWSFDVSFFDLIFISVLDFDKRAQFFILRFLFFLF